MKKLLVYNMPDKYLQVIKSLNDKYASVLYEADNSDLASNVAYLIDEREENKLKDGKHQAVDINFLMIHGFNDDELNEFLKDLKENELSLPNKCVSTKKNLSWSLYELLEENKEDSELMPILVNLQKVYRVGASLIENGQEDSELKEVVNKIARVFNEQKFELKELRDLYNSSIKVVNKFLK